ncbi:hypothetical protein DID78_04600 [Candidatus Marinamargulisbacteria bacterium SCGC AG-343-D04]|nr:hypothetical protein DID78_04600 [Candidatus Marinamargulisbacteria bacterium SCGC AG-343-D04]
MICINDCERSSRVRPVGNGIDSDDSDSDDSVDEGRATSVPEYFELEHPLDRTTRNGIVFISPSVEEDGLTGVSKVIEDAYLGQIQVEKTQSSSDITLGWEPISKSETIVPKELGSLKKETFNAFVTSTLQRPMHLGWIAAMWDSKK